MLNSLSISVGFKNYIDLERWTHASHTKWRYILVKTFDTSFFSPKNPTLDLLSSSVSILHAEVIRSAHNTKLWSSIPEKTCYVQIRPFNCKCKRHIFKTWWTVRWVFQAVYVEILPLIFWCGINYLAIDTCLICDMKNNRRCYLGLLIDEIYVADVHIYPWPYGHYLIKSMNKDPYYVLNIRAEVLVSRHLI